MVDDTPLETNPPDPFFAASMQVFDSLCAFDPRYRPLLIEIGLDPGGLNAMLNELRNSLFDRHEIIEHQIKWLRGVYAEINPVKRRTNYRPLTPGRPRGKL